MSKSFSRIAHIIVMVLCAVVMALYFILPVWRVSLTYNVSADSIKSMLGSEFKDYDLDDAIPEEGVGIQLNVDISVTYLFGAVFQPDGMKSVDSLIENNVDSIVDSISSCLGDISKTVIRVVAKETIKEEVKASVKDYLTSNGSDTSGTAVQQKMEEWGVTDEVLDSGADIVVDAMYAEDATVDSVTDTIMQVVEDTYADIAEASGNEITLSESTKESIRSQVESVITQFANEDGSITMDAKMQEYMLQILQTLQSDASEAAVSVDVTSFADEVTTETETTTATNEEIKAALKESLTSQIPDEAYTYIHLGVLAVFMVLLISLCCWLYIFIKCLVKLIEGSLDTMVKLKAAIIFGWLPFFIFMAAPSLAVYILTNFVPEMAESFASLSIGFFSSGLSAFIAAVSLIIFTIVRSCMVRNVHKQAIAQNRADAIKAKKTAADEIAAERAAVISDSDEDVEPEEKEPQAEEPVEDEDEDLEPWERREKDLSKHNKQG